MQHVYSILLLIITQYLGPVVKFWCSAGLDGSCSVYISSNLGQDFLSKILRTNKVTQLWLLIYLL